MQPFIRESGALPTSYPTSPLLYIGGGKCSVRIVEIPPTTEVKGPEAKNRGRCIDRSEIKWKTDSRQVLNIFVLLFLIYNLLYEKFMF